MHNDYASRASEYICLCMQFSVGEAGVPDFQKALEPLRQLLAEYPYLGGKGPSYSDHFVAGFFMVGLPPLILNFLCSLMCSHPWREFRKNIDPFWSCPIQYMAGRRGLNTSMHLLATRTSVRGSTAVLQG